MEHTMGSTSDKIKGTANQAIDKPAAAANKKL